MEARLVTDEPAPVVSLASFRRMVEVFVDGAEARIECRSEYDAETIERRLADLRARRATTEV